jgi:hypothetical protein
MSKFLGTVAAVAVALCIAVMVAGCGSSASSGNGGFGSSGRSTPAPWGPPAPKPAPDGGGATNPGADSDSGASSTPPDSGTSTPPDDADSDSGASIPPPDSGTTTAPPDSGSAPVTSNDGFSAARTACINEINRLRATQSLAAYTLSNTDTVNTCVDAQATSDEAANSAHQAWIAAEGSTCDGNAQDECLGGATDPAGIVSCLDSMWAEQNQPNCTGCVGCMQFGGACANCDFYGMNGPECGHYVNMSATYFTSVACGFSTSGDWAAQNFYQ